MKSDERDAWKGLVALLLIIIYAMAVPDSWPWALGAGIFGLLLAVAGFRFSRVAWFLSRYR